MAVKILHPELFQGNLKKKRYFEGWYFKHVSNDLNHVFSFIPGISLSDDDPHSFIQVINGITGKTNYITYPVNAFLWEKNKLSLKIGDSIFTDKYINLNLENEEIKVTGRLEYSNIVKYPKTLLSPGIMGWYSYIPFMECKHGIVSVNHDLHGKISVNGSLIDFDNGKGYIEKDWGVSFPEAWIWMQSNSFMEHGTSFTLSIAKIPWMGRYFIGFIAFLYFNKKFYLFSTYNKSIVSYLNHNKETVDVSVRNKKYILKIRVSKNSFGDLVAPVSGEMSRCIKESIDSEIHLRLSDINNNLEYEGSGKNVGLEIIDKIFDYF